MDNAVVIHKYLSKMKKEIKKSELISICRHEFDLLKFTGKWKESLLAGIQRLAGFMEMKNLENYSEAIGEEFIAQQPEQPAYLKRINGRAIYLLDSFIGGDSYRLIPPRKTYVFPGEIGASAQRFINEEKLLKRLSRQTVKTYTAALSHFSVEMEIRKATLQTLRRQDVMMFISSVQNMNAHIFMPLRKFLGFLHDTAITEQDFSELLRNLKYSRGSKLPSVYTPEEIIHLEKSIQRGSSTGKRNYAMLLLASRLGLRASDIVNLEISCLDWENKSIRFSQLKTGRPIELPLLGDVGDAIIDYILHGRPKTGIKKIFVTATNPVRTLMASNMCTIVARMLSEAGIEMRGRHHGGLP